MPARSVPNAYAARATRRCATIFAGTRRLIAQRGLLKVTMRHLAQEGDASIQTLYNLVGDRERIIVEALKEHIGAMSVFAGRSQEYPNPVIAMADAHFAAAVRWQRYTLNTLAGPAPTRIFHAELERYLIQVHLDFFRQLDNRGALRVPVDYAALSRRILLYSTSVIVDWGGRVGSERELRDELLTGVSSLLMRALSSEALAQMESWLDGQKDS